MVDRASGGCLRAHPNAKVVAIVQNETSTGLVLIRGVAQVVQNGCSVHGRRVSSVGGMDIKVDDWGVVCALTSQKCMEAPPGLTCFGGASRRTHEGSQDSHPGWAMNLLKWKSLPTKAEPCTLLHHYGGESGARYTALKMILEGCRLALSGMENSRIFRKGLGSWV